MTRSICDGPFLNYLLEREIEKCEEGETFYSGDEE